MAGPATAGMAGPAATAAAGLADPATRGLAGPAARPAGPAPPAPPRGGQGRQPGWPAQPPGYPPPAREPDNYLVWGILVTVMCCLPFGIVSIINSNKVSSLWAQGQYAEAQAAADSAKK